MDLPLALRRDARQTWVQPEDVPWLWIETSALAFREAQAVPRAEVQIAWPAGVLDCQSVAPGSIPAGSVAVAQRLTTRPQPRRRLTRALIWHCGFHSCDCLHQRDARGRFGKGVRRLAHIG